MLGNVFNIQKFSTDDGPGIRTTVFLKGCNLRCVWCHNPESFDSAVDIQYYSQKCTNCGKCVEVCPAQAHRLEQDKHLFCRDLCTKCGKCVAVCLPQAVMSIGKTMTTQEVMVEVEKDRAFYKQSNGGVTFSGGEPMLQIDFLKELLKQSKACSFHTAVDTAGHVPWNHFLDILPDVDLFLFDVKAIDDTRHMALTGATNRRVLDNLTRLCATGKTIWVRVPVVPGVNMVDDEAERMIEFLSGLKGMVKLELLPYHQFGNSKYESLQLDYSCKDCIPPTKERMDTLKQMYKATGIEMV